MPKAGGRGAQASGARGAALGVPGATPSRTRMSKSPSAAAQPSLNGCVGLVVWSI